MEPSSFGFCRPKAAELSDATGRQQSGYTGRAASVVARAGVDPNALSIVCDDKELPRWHFDAEQRRSSSVHDEFKRDGLLHRQLGRRSSRRVLKRRFNPTPAVADFQQRLSAFGRFRSHLDTAHSLVKPSSRVFCQDPQEPVLKPFSRQPLHGRTKQRGARAAPLMRAQKIDRVDFRVEATRRLTPGASVDESSDPARVLGDNEAPMPLCD